VSIREVPRKTLIKTIEALADHGGLKKLPPGTVDRILDALTKDAPEWTPVWVFFDVYARVASSLTRLEG